MAYSSVEQFGQQFRQQYGLAIYAAIRILHTIDRTTWRMLWVVRLHFTPINNVGRRER